MTTQPAQARPGTVTAVCIILFVGAALGVLGGCGLVVAGSSAELAQEAGIDGGLAMGLGIVTLILAVVQAVLALLLWRGSNGARVALIVLQFIDIALSFGSFDLSTILSILISIVILVLLFNPATKQYTGAAARA